MSGLPGPPDPGDPSVLDPDVRLHDAEQRIQHDRARDDRVELALGGRAVVLGHPGAPVLRVAPERLVGRIGEVAFDPDPEVGVAQPDAVAGGRAVARRVLGARVPLRHAARPPSLRTGRGPPRASRRAPIAESRPPAGRAGTRRPPSRSNSRCSFARQNGKCEDTRIGCSPRLVTRRWIRSRPGRELDVALAEPDRAGTVAPAGPNGSRRTMSRVPSSRRTSTRISGTMPATPSITWSGRTASRPAAATSSKDAPPRPAACISSHTSATASGAFSRSPFASVARASWAAVKTRSRSSSVGVSCTRRAYPRSR